MFILNYYKSHISIWLCRQTWNIYAWTAAVYTHNLWCNRNNLYLQKNKLYKIQLITAVLINNVTFLLYTFIHLYICCIHLYNCISVSRQSHDTDDGSICRSNDIYTFIKTNLYTNKYMCVHVCARLCVYVFRFLKSCVLWKATSGASWVWNHSAIQNKSIIIL